MHCVGIPPPPLKEELCPSFPYLFFFRKKSRKGALIAFFARGCYCIFPGCKDRLMKPNGQFPLSKFRANCRFLFGAKMRGNSRRCLHFLLSPSNCLEWRSGKTTEEEEISLNCEREETVGKKSRWVQKHFKQNIFLFLEVRAHNGLELLTPQKPKTHFAEKRGKWRCERLHSSKKNPLLYLLHHLR